MPRRAFSHCLVCRTPAAGYLGCSGWDTRTRYACPAHLPPLLPEYLLPVYLLVPVTVRVMPACRYGPSAIPGCRSHAGITDALDGIYRVVCCTAAPPVPPFGIPILLVGLCPAHHDPTYQFSLVRSPVGHTTGGLYYAPHAPYLPRTTHTTTYPYLTPNSTRLTLTAATHAFTLLRTTRNSVLIRMPVLHAATHYSVYALNILLTLTTLPCYAGRV